MSNLFAIPTPDVSIINGVPKTTSLAVADLFSKRHDHVLRDIQSLDIPKDFSLSNFGESNYTTERGRTYPMYTMTKDGFTLLAMGYTGKEAMQFKVAYINEFNRMEATLRTQARDANEELDKFGELYDEVTELRCKISQLFDSTASHLAKLAATREVDRQHAPALESQTRVLSHIMTANDLMRVVTEAIERGTYPFPYQLRCAGKSPTLTIKLKDMLAFLNDSGIRHSFMSTRDIRAHLYTNALIVREPVHFYRFPNPRYLNCTMIDLSSFLGGVQ